MPLYEYECRTCGKRTELLQRMDDPPLAACPQCGGEVKKLLSAPAVQFKGSGWYVTDYAGKKPPAKSSEGKSEGAAESKGKEGAPEKKESKESKPASGGSGGGSDA